MIELSEIAEVKRQIISPASSVPIFGIVQDGPIAGYNLSQPNVRIDWREAMNLISYTSIDDLSVLKKNTEYRGSDIFSIIIPGGIYIDSAKVKIVDGKIDHNKSILDKKTLAPKQNNSIIHNIWDKYGIEFTKNFIDDSQRLLNNFNLKTGFSTGIGDVMIKQELYDQVNKFIEGKKLEVDCSITEHENNPDLLPDELFEASVYADLNTVRDELSNVIVDNVADDNSIDIMIKSGSKGGKLHMAQMSCSIGQQALEGQRIKKKLNKRSLIYFPQNDDSADARGFISESFLEGMTPVNYVFHQMTSREGLISTAIKSVTGDTPIMILDNGVTRTVDIGPWIDNLLDENSVDVQHYEEREMELLNLKEKMYIPTTDEDGNVTWGDIKAVTRHDPGKELYEIKTKGGRSVIVTESKSLLIWNHDTCKFEMKDTPLVEVGDYVPVTMSLCEPDTPHDISIEEAKKKIRDICGHVSVKSTSDELMIAFMSDEDTYILIMMLNRLGIHCEIDIGFCMNVLRIRGRWAKMFEEITGIFSIADGDEITEEIHNDVVLDAIIEINKVDVKKYPKVYDLTIPSTLNFGLANGLHVVDTAESGYVQRRLIKALEDLMIKYDNTVRTAKEVIVQYIYGDSGISPTHHYKTKIRTIKASNSEIKEKYIPKDMSKASADKYMRELLRLRDIMRYALRKGTLSSDILEETFNTPINFPRVLNDVLHSPGKGKLTHDYVIDEINKMLSIDKTMLVAYNKNTKSKLKLNDDANSKTLFKLALYENFGPMASVNDHKLSKEQFDNAIRTMTDIYNRAVIEAGEMIGIIAAQSLGEPVTQMTLDTFHHTGIGSKSTTGVTRVKEILSCSRSIKAPIMRIHLNDDKCKSMDMANKIAYHIKYTTINHIRDKIDVYYDPDPLSSGSIMKKDNAVHVYHSHTINKTSCQSDIGGMPWLMRIQLNRDQMISKEITLLDIKSKFCNFWNKRFQTKNLKRDDKMIFDRVVQLAILSNDDSSQVPVIHIRFNVQNVNLTMISKFASGMVDNFKLKGFDTIEDIGGVSKHPYVTYDNDGGANTSDDDYEHIIYTGGTDLKNIRYLNNINLERTITNDIVEVYDTFGIESARTVLIKELMDTYKGSGGSLTWQHATMLADNMCNTGTLVTVDRHRLNKVDIDPMARASFEKTVDQFTMAAVFGERDEMKSVSSRIMAGQTIKGGTGYCNLILDHDAIIKSEFTEDNEQKYGKTSNEVDIDPIIHDTMVKEAGNVFIPE